MNPPCADLRESQGPEERDLVRKEGALKGQEGEAGGQEEVRSVSKAKTEVRAEKIKKNLELFKTNLKHPDITRAHNSYDERHETRVAYKLLYDELKDEASEIKNIIAIGKEQHDKMKEHIIALEETIAACDVGMTERLLHENERLKNEIKSLKETKNGDKYQKAKRHCKLARQSQSQNSRTFPSHIW